MKTKILILAAFSLGFCIGTALAEEPVAPAPTPSNAILDPNINDQQEILNMRKLDLRPGDILPRGDNQYNLGNSGYRWANVNSTTITVRGYDILQWISNLALLNAQ